MDTKAISTSSPITAILTDLKFSEKDIKDFNAKLSEEIQLGAIWILIQSRGDDSLVISEMTLEQKQQYIDSFPAEEYSAALESSSSHYISDFFKSLLSAATPADREIILAKLAKFKLI